MTAATDEVEATEAADLPLDEGMTLDYITGDPVKETPKELVRQRIARALLHEYAISVEDMEPDFRLKIDGKNKKVDIAIFEPGAAHTVEHLRRIVICDKEPTNGKKGAYRLRDHDQAKRDVEQLQLAMLAAPNCKYGLWTNGLEFFFFERKDTRFSTEFNPLGDWPQGDESVSLREVASFARLRRADPEMLRITFRRCHNFIHGNEGMPKDAAFWQFLYLIFAKMHDEKRSRSALPNFWAAPDEQFNEAGRKRIRERILPIFEDVKTQYASIFRGNEEITLSDRALAFMVNELAKYDLGRTDVDAKGVAYQEIVGDNLRGDRGQFFTPRGAIRLAIAILDPKPNERFLDPACGPAGFIVETIDHQNRRFHAEAKLRIGAESTEEFLSIQERLAHYARTYLFGADFDQFLVRAAQMNVVMAANAEAQLFHMDSLEFPRGYLNGVEAAKQAIKLGTIQVLGTNPPFGADIPITDRAILEQYQLAYIWERTPDGGFRNTGRLKGNVAPEVLFIERCIQWLCEGGRMGIVLPDGILGNPGDEYIRWWILRHCWVLASVDLPVEAFIVEANVNILTSLLFLKKKSQAEIQAIDLGGEPEYPVFMAVAEKVGFDRRGNTLYKRGPDGEEIIEELPVIERISVGGYTVERTLRRKTKVLDDDLPAIADAYRAFRAQHAEPGL
jgi:type I restriction enzyme M protein